MSSTPNCDKALVRTMPPIDVSDRRKTDCGLETCFWGSFIGDAPHSQLQKGIRYHALVAVHGMGGCRRGGSSSKRLRLSVAQRGTLKTMKGDIPSFE